jgi:sodium/potassium-transporting ATPase subunit alpha
MANITRALSIKGAPDILLPRCSSALQQDGTVKPLLITDLEQIELVKDQWSRRGKRVILVAEKGVSHDAFESLTSSNAEKVVLELAQKNLTFLGLLGITDPLVQTPSSYIWRECRSSN